MKSSIFITRKLPEAIVKSLEHHFEIKMWEEEDTPVPRSVLLKEIQDVEGIYCLLTDTIDEEVIKGAPNLKVISNMAVGFNNIDIQAAEQQGIVVTNTPGVLTETTADLTFTLLMSTARRIVEASDYLRNGNWDTWSPMLLTGQEIHGSTLGIIGLGRIGEAVAKRAKGFGMNLLYYNRTRKFEKEEEIGIQYADLDTLLKESDFVCVMIPYSPKVHHFIGKDELALMKPNAIVINTSRGGIVDEEALYESLVNKQIWGAGLDVFEEEPVSTNHPLLSLSNVVTLPHIGSASVNTRLKMAQLAADNIIHVLNDKSPLTPVNS
ncbi:D-glycerate dehydrogenase [Halobacillus andaensis]|uniref:D-glycerate dehydrogenase n=1 Tax=Halobacillus andaensis TaxID=1176239 RepID=A0A917B7G5_HALAA|nr:D-glycerate dehydrogenase [Halobacillus andaensis]MBP2004274.1 glyoxylate reductase [Halobacillus andaensis]GGF22924.1 D-glycerate dehydrogenase [Halobacillus andaensis]